MCHCFPDTCGKEQLKCTDPTACTDPTVWIRVSNPLLCSVMAGVHMWIFSHVRLHFELGAEQIRMQVIGL